MTHHFEIDTFSLVLSLHKWWFAYMISTKVRTVLTTNTTTKIKFLKSFKCLNEGLYELTFVSSVLSVPSVKLHPSSCVSASILHISGVKPNLHNRHDPLSK